MPPTVRPPTAETAYGHYQVEQRADGSPWILGRGGMGVTFKALDTNLHCPVALKIISPGCFVGEDSERRFVREARLAARIRHPNVAAIHHLDRHQGQFFYAMEFVDGITAEAWVRQRGVMAPELALDIVMQVARALTAAFRLKVVHRDIKPSNIMLLPDPANDSRVIAKLIDFGLARSIAGEASPDATTCGFTGTPQFASPEQAESLELDVRSDIYSLGSTFWYLLVGQAPFQGTPARVIAQLLTAEPPWERVRHLPRKVVRLLRTMLAKDPGARPQNPVILHEEISACRDTLAAEAALPPPKYTWRNAYRNHGLRSAAFAGLLGLVLVWLALSHRPHEAKIPIVAMASAVDSRPSFPEPVTAPEPKSPSAAVAASPLPVQATVPPPQVATAPVAPPPSLNDAPSSPFPDRSGDLALAQPAPDAQTAARLNNQGGIAFQLPGLSAADADDTSETADATSTANPASPSKEISGQGAMESRRTSHQRHSSPSHPIDKIRGKVQGIIRHLF